MTKPVGPDLRRVLLVTTRPEAFADWMAELENLGQTVHVIAPADLDEQNIDPPDLVLFGHVAGTLQLDLGWRRQGQRAEVLRRIHPNAVLVHVTLHTDLPEDAETPPDDAKRWVVLDIIGNLTGDGDEQHSFRRDLADMVLDFALDDAGFAWVVGDNPDTPSENIPLT